jgi:hypothetical protein
MPTFETSLTAQLKRAVDAVKDEIAKDGLSALKKVLDESGFSKSQYLKNYEVYSHVNSQGILFEILVEVEATDIDLKKVHEDATASVQEFEAAADRTYKIISRGGFNRVAQMRDMRREVPSALKPTKDNLHRIGPATHSKLKNSGHRKLEHGIALAAPRSMNINREGKLSVQFAKQTRTTKSGEIHLPQGKFQGITKKFIDELKKIVLSSFAPELEKIMKNYIG